MPDLQDVGRRDYGVQGGGVPGEAPLFEELLDEHRLGRYVDAPQRAHEVRRHVDHLIAQVQGLRERDAWEEIPLGVDPTVGRRYGRAPELDLPHVVHVPQNFRLPELVGRTRH